MKLNRSTASSIPIRGWNVRRHPRATRSEGASVLELAVVHVAGFSVTQRDAKDVDAPWRS